MADMTLKKIDDMESVFDGAMVRARASLGVRSFGMQILDLPPGFEDYPEHDEASTRQEEVYVPLRGKAILHVENAKHDLEPGMMVRLGPGTKRKIVPGSEGVRLLCLGGVPGEAYVAPEWTKAGAPVPSMK